PAAEPCDDPGSKGKIFLTCSLAFKPSRQGHDEWLVFGFEARFDRLPATIARLDQLHDAYCGYRGNCGKIDESLGVTKLTVLDPEARTLESAEQLLDPPAALVEIDALARPSRIVDFMAGQQQPMDRGHSRRSIHLLHVHCRE